MKVSLIVRPQSATACETRGGGGGGGAGGESENVLVCPSFLNGPASSGRERAHSNSMMMTTTTTTTNETDDFAIPSSDDVLTRNGAGFGCVDDDFKRPCLSGTTECWAGDEIAVSSV